MPEINSNTRPPDFPDTKPFIFKEPNTFKDINVDLTSWIWQVQYVDEAGGFLNQYDFDTWEFHQFKEIDTTRPLIFKMVHAIDSDLSPYTLLFNPETMKLIHFYRNGILKNITEFPRLHVFGYEKKIIINKKEVVVKTFFVILPSGELIITDNMELIHF